MVNKLTGQQLAVAFRQALKHRLSNDLDFPAGFAAERLAREFHDGVSGLLASLERESTHSEEYPYSHILDQIMVAWSSAADQRDLVLATGRNRDGWLALV